jgi:rare lipoprotein A
MQYRIQSGSAAAATQRFTARGTTGTAARGSWSGEGAQVAVQPSFQEFLAQQTKGLSTNEKTDALETAAEIATQPAAETVHTLKKGETVWELARKQYQVDPNDILRLNHITNPNTLQVGQQLRIPAREQGGVAAASEEVVAGWYGRFHQGKRMANGERFDMNKATIAHRDMPIGSKVELENPETGQKVRAVVTDRGPYHQGRDVDLSYGLAKRLSIAEQGVGKLKMRPL